MTANQLVPAAQYLRKSTEHQQYSLENQSTAIQRYADSQGFEVVRTYSDAAKSGLVLRHRIGLRQLLQDVVSGSPDYRVILVTMSAAGDDFKTPTSPPITSSFVNPQAFRCTTAPRPLQTTAPFLVSS